jgi:serine/threonine protein kinase
MTAEPSADRLLAGRYALQEVLGRGGMGVVWLATDLRLDRPVAVKEVTFALHLSDEERRVLRERTLREARTAARLDHPSVTAVYDVVEEDGRPWLVMEHVESCSLQQVIDGQGPLPWPAVARIGLDVLAGLTAAHEAGVVHRDVKPANVLVRDGTLFLIDSAFAELRPSPWRQAVDLANMMLVLGLRTDAEQVYRRARLQFTDEEIAEAFAATRGLTMPTQLRRMLRQQGRDLHAEFLRLLPYRLPPVRIQRWSWRRVGLTVVTLLALALASGFLLDLIVRSPL